MEKPSQQVQKNETEKTQEDKNTSIAHVTNTLLATLLVINCITIYLNFVLINNERLTIKLLESLLDGVIYTAHKE